MRMLCWLTALTLAGAAGCSPSLIANLTEERSGDVTVLFINTTNARAAFTFGMYDSFNRNPPGTIVLRQQLIEAHASVDPVTITCARNFAIGTDEMIQRAIDTSADDVANFNRDSFTRGVNFSSAPVGSDAQALPTAGTARPFEALLGVDYSCGDQLVITFVEDIAAPGGFRVDYSVIRDAEDDAFGIEGS